MTNVDSLRAKLTTAQSRFLTVADTIPSHFWQTPPSPGAWSAAEVVAHLCQIESSIIANSIRILHHPPRPVPFLKRFRLPLFFSEYRVRRFKYPLTVDSSLLAEKDPMLARLRTVRERTLAFLDETQSRNLSQYSWPHPFLGMFNVYAWIELIACHQLRHAKQVHEIATLLPNHVVTSQK
ncbi:MAG TPA: DinB family protein [Candidatus Acidoferrum sp.]|nr:DinB family protein [Candidatus Acidoferrum sp.]